jgi:hypothetical protein
MIGCRCGRAFVLETGWKLDIFSPGFIDCRPGNYSSKERWDLDVACRPETGRQIYRPWSRRAQALDFEHPGQPSGDASALRRRHLAALRRSPSSKNLTNQFFFIDFRRKIGKFWSKFIRNQFNRQKYKILTFEPFFLNFEANNSTQKKNQLPSF